MNTRLPRLFLYILLILVMATPSLPIARAQEGPPQVGLRPDAPPYALHGPYWVGVQDFMIEDGRETPLQVHAWYPALNETGAAEEITYKAVLKDPDVAGTIVDMYGHALQDAAVDSRGAPYPLVVFSHGFGTPAYIYAHLAEHYASYGFVVLVPEHQESFDWEMTDLIPSLIGRPQDIVQVLDYAEVLTAAGGALEGIIDMAHVAVAGHSLGGYTTLAMAGAQFDLAAFNQRCETATPDVAWLCTPIVPFEADMAELAGLDPMPEGLWPSFGDPRVDAIVPMASDSYLFDEAGLAQITIPMLAMGGTRDQGTPYEWGTHPAYQYASSASKALVAFENGDHMIFGISVEDSPYLLDTDWVTWYMDAVWDKQRVHDLIHHFSTAFLLNVLKGDAEAGAALAPEAAMFPGIIYDAQGF